MLYKYFGSGAAPAINALLRVADCENVAGGTDHIDDCLLDIIDILVFINKDVFVFFAQLQRGLRRPGFFIGQQSQRKMFEVREIQAVDCFFGLAIGIIETPDQFDEDFCLCADCTGEFVKVFGI